jgi:adenylyltransferase/sulfurtransferase
VNSSLSDSELQRYSRHLLLPEFGRAGQQSLKAAHVAVIGAGGLGSPLILYLAGAGIGTITVIDFDSVERSNLQRQIIYIDENVGQPKAVQAAQRAMQLNPEVQVRHINARFDEQNAFSILESCDIVVDGSDNFATRYLVNDACVMLRKPNVHGAIYRFEGQASVFACADGPCYRCLFPEPPAPDEIPNCAEAGVLGVMAGVIGCIQATETIKLISGIGTPLKGKLLLYDALSMRFDTLPINKNPDCPVCGKEPKIRSLRESVISCQGKETAMNPNVISATELQKELRTGKQLFLLDVRTNEEVALSKLPNSKHIPLAELPMRTAELSKSEDIVVYCKSGGRSMRAMQFLNEHGFDKVRNLTGGITAWAQDVDQTVQVS